MASGINKPDGLTVILPEHAQDFVEALTIEKFHGIDKSQLPKAQLRNSSWGGSQATYCYFSATLRQGGTFLLQDC